MSEQETGKILFQIGTIYPNAYSKSIDEENHFRVRMWAVLFENVPFETVEKALLYFFKYSGSKYAPAPAQIYEIIYKDNDDEKKAWEMVKKALSSSISNSKSEFDKLPKEIQESLGTHKILKEWATKNYTEIETVLKKEFMESYRLNSHKIPDFSKLLSNNSKANLPKLN